MYRAMKRKYSEVFPNAGSYNPCFVPNNKKRLLGSVDDPVKPCRPGLFSRSHPQSLIELCRTIPSDIVVHVLLPFVESHLVVTQQDDQNHRDHSFLLKRMFGYFATDCNRSIYPLFPRVEYRFTMKEVGFHCISGEFDPTFWGQVKVLSFSLKENHLKVLMERIVSTVRMLFEIGKPFRLQRISLPSFFTSECHDCITQSIQSHPTTLQRNLTTIESVELSHDNVVKYLSCCPNLKTLSFPLDHRLWYSSPQNELINECDQKAVSKMAEVVNSHKHVEHLSLGNGWQRCAVQLLNVPSLVSLSLYNFSWNNLHMTNVNKGMKKVVLDANDTIISNMLIQCPCIEELWVIRSAFQPSSITDVGLMKISNCLSLKKLLLQSIEKFQDGKLAKLAQMPNLEELVLRDCSVTKNGLKRLFSPQGALQRVVIHKSRTKGDMFHSLPRIISLDELEVSETILTQRDLVYLLRSAQIKKLKISLSKNSCAGMNELTEVLSSWKAPNYSLSELHVINYSFSIEQVVQLCGMLPNLKYLYVSLSQNFLDYLSALTHSLCRTRLLELGCYYFGTRHEQHSLLIRSQNLSICPRLASILQWSYEQPTNQPYLHLIVFPLNLIH